MGECEIVVTHMFPIVDSALTKRRFAMTEQIADRGCVSSKRVHVIGEATHQAVRQVGTQTLALYPAIELVHGLRHQERRADRRPVGRRRVG